MLAIEAEMLLLCFVLILNTLDEDVVGREGVFLASFELKLANTTSFSSTYFVKVLRLIQFRQLKHILV